MKKMNKGIITATSFNNCILISKRGTLKEIYLTECEQNREHYIKVCATPPTYEKSLKHHTTWRVKKNSFPVELWARTDGRAGQENKYEFPPPVDETLFFGDCMLVSRAPFTVALWQKLYKQLFGGFDDLTKMADDDDAEIDELETVSEKKKTRDGYLKDGFIVGGSAAAAEASRVLHKLKSKTKLKLPSDSSTNITIPENLGQRINIGFDEIIVDDSESESSDNESSSASQNMNCTDNEDTDDNNVDDGVNDNNNDGNSEPEIGVKQGDGDGDGDGEGGGEGEEITDSNEITEKAYLNDATSEKSNVNAITVAGKIALPSTKTKPKKSRVTAKKPAKKRAGLVVDTRMKDNEDTASELDEEIYDV